MNVTEKVLKKIIDSYPLAPPENGGILGSKAGIICEYFHDKCSIMDRAVYVPNVEMLNSVIEKWSENGIDFAGIIHSHISDNGSLSYNDKIYICSIFDNLPISVNSLFFPIFLPKTSKIIPYVAVRGNRGIVFIKDNVCVTEARDDETY